MAKRAKKTNLRRIPASMADVERARTDGAEQGLTVAIYAAVKRLEEQDVTEEAIKQYASDVMDVCDSITKDY